MKVSSFLAFALANSSRLCSATPALRRQDQDQDQDPRKLQVVQSKHGSRALEGVDYFEGRCLDSEGRHYDRITFDDIADDQECLLTCPPTNFVGYQLANRWCTCRYSKGYVLDNICPDAAAGAHSCGTAVNGGVGPVVRGDGTGGIICQKANFQERITSLLEEVAALSGAAVAVGEEAAAFGGVVATHFGGLCASPFRELFKDADTVPTYVTYWDVSGVINFFKMFFGATNMNQDIGSWDVSRGTAFGSMFARSNFNQDIGNWDVRNGIDFDYMFYDTNFDQDIGNWDVRNGIWFNHMFSGTNFNQDIGNWDVTDGIYFDSMFARSNFNQDIGNWVVRNGIDFSLMFAYTNFNQDIGNWDVTNGIWFWRMFKSTPFRQDLSGWRITVEAEDRVTDMFKDSLMNNINECPCISVGEGDWLRRCPGVQGLDPIPCNDADGYASDNKDVDVAKIVAGADALSTVI